MRRRILFTFAGGSGHAEPLVPLAAAARDAGHSIAFAGRPTVVAGLAERGFPVFADAASAVDRPPTSNRSRRSTWRVSSAPSATASPRVWRRRVRRASSPSPGVAARLSSATTSTSEP